MILFSGNLKYNRSLNSGAMDMLRSQIAHRPQTVIARDLPYKYNMALPLLTDTKHLIIDGDSYFGQPPKAHLDTTQPLVILTPDKLGL